MVAGTWRDTCFGLQYRIKNGPFSSVSQKGTFKYRLNTLPKTNIAPTNGWLEYYFPIGEAYFQGLR